MRKSIRTYISIIILTVNGLNVPTKRYRLAELIHKQDPQVCCLQEIHFRRREHTQTESERTEKDSTYKCKSKKKTQKTGVANLISDKIDLKIKNITRDKRQYIIIKGLIQEEDITMVKFMQPT